LPYAEGTPVTLYLPPHVAAEERKRFAAEVAARVDVDQRCVEFTAKLQQIDPHLVMVKARNLIAPGTPLRPGFYHVLRFNEDAPMTIMAVHENERYVEPDSRLFDVLARGHMTQRRVMDDIEHHDREVERAAQRESARAREDRTEELKDRVNAVSRVQVSMDRSVPWTQNDKGRRPQ
jgi:hypothetical protein